MTNSSSAWSLGPVNLLWGCCDPPPCRLAVLLRLQPANAWRELWLQKLLFDRKTATASPSSHPHRCLKTHNDDSLDVLVGASPLFLPASVTIFTPYLLCHLSGWLGSEWTLWTQRHAIWPSLRLCVCTPARATVVFTNVAATMTCLHGYRALHPRLLLTAHIHSPGSEDQLKQTLQNTRLKASLPSFT